MKITVHSSKSVKPAYGDCSGGHDDDNAPAAAAVAVIPLTVFDEVNHDEYVPGIFLYHPPPPPTAALEAGLARMLAEYREWAGRLVAATDNASGRRAICLNDAGARFVEASADVALAAVMPLRMGPEAVKLHPSCDGAEELILVQVVCGSIAVGYSMHHSVADGYATSTCLLAWGQATRGAVGFDPVPVHDRASFFVPRHPPLVEFEHRGNEFKKPGTRRDDDKALDDDDEVIVETVHFRREFIAQLKSRASLGTPAAPKQRSYSAAICVVAHLWRCITKARGLNADEVTRLHIAVNGRRGRMTNPRVPDGYTGNVVLWARPATTARELVEDDTPLRHTVELVSKAVARVDDRYFRSFIDFASSGAVEREGLVRTAVVTELASRTNVEVDSVLGFPFYDLDFGTGKPVLFMPTAQPVEGAVFLVPPPASSSDGGVVAYVPLFHRAVDAFRRCCYSLPLVAEARY